MPDPSPTPKLSPDLADRLFKILTDAHEGLNAQQSAALNARLVLLLAAEFGDPSRLHALCGQAAGPEGKSRGR